MSLVDYISSVSLHSFTFAVKFASTNSAMAKLHLLSIFILTLYSEVQGEVRAAGETE